MGVDRNIVHKDSWLHFILFCKSVANGMVCNNYIICHHLSINVDTQHYDQFLL